MKQVDVDYSQAEYSLLSTWLPIFEVRDYVDATECRLYC